MRDFGDLEAELANARAATVVVPLTDFGVIAIDGEDAVGFAHNLLTNDIKSLGEDNACLAGLCNPKGRLLATLLVWPEAQGLRLSLAADLLPTVQKKLSMYVLRSKVRLSDASRETLLLGLSGPSAATVLSTLGAASTGKVARFAGGSSIALGGDRYLIAVTAEAAQSCWQQMVGLARPAGSAAWRWLEIVAGIPRVSAAVQEEFVPQMLNYELVGGLNFSKGCYPGQEIVARSQYLGKVKRRMYRLQLADRESTLAAGDQIYAQAGEEQPCGRVVQVAPSPLGGFEALAVLQSSSVGVGDVHLGSTSGPALRFLPLPYDPDS